MRRFAMATEMMFQLISVTAILMAAPIEPK